MKKEVASLRVTCRRQKDLLSLSLSVLAVKKRLKEQQQVEHDLDLTVKLFDASLLVDTLDAKVDELLALNQEKQALLMR